LENLRQPHSQFHDLPLHNGARAEDGHDRGSDKGSEKHRVHTNESDPLVHQLKTSDWQAHALKHKESAVGKRDHLPDLQLTEHDQYKQSLSNAKLSPAERLEAAHHLIDDGVRSVHFKDQQGQDHDYHLRLFNSGRVRVTEGDQTVVQDAGFRTPAPASEAGSPAGRSGTRSGERAQTSGGKSGDNSQKIAHSPPGALQQQNNHLSHPSAVRQTAGGHEKNQDQGGGLRQSAPPADGSKVYSSDKTIVIPFTHLDVDGDGTSKDKYDQHYRSQTALQRSDGEFLNAKKDRYFVLNKEMAAKYGIQPGDIGRLVNKDTGEWVSVVFGDTTLSANRLMKYGRGEASLAAVQALGFKHANGNNAAPDGNYEIQFVRGSGNGTGDIARNPLAMEARLNRLNQVASAN
jgi:hypothetical protein